MTFYQPLKEESLELYPCPCCGGVTEVFRTLNFFRKWRSSH